MIFECTWTISYRGGPKICSGIVVNILYNSNTNRYEAAVLQVDNGFKTGYNPKTQIVHLDNLLITPKKG